MLFAAPFWLLCAAVVVTAALRSRHDPQAARTGLQGLAALYLLGGALVNALLLATGEDYADFADGSAIPFVRNTWRQLVVPHHELFISVLIAFEAVVGALALLGRRAARLALIAAIGFHVALVSFGWGFLLWSAPMVTASLQLLRVTRCAAQPSARRQTGPSPV